jgi:hypothetical protein
VSATVKPKGEEEDVGYYADFDRYVIGERNEDVRREVQTLRLEKWLCENGEPPPMRGSPPSSRRARCRCCTGQVSRASYTGVRHG